jgi:hypothetical protein
MNQILLLTDQPSGAFAAHLGLLYPGRLTVADFTTTAHDAATLKQYSHVVTMVTHRSRLGKLDYAALREYAASGGTVASCLAEYAASLGLSVTKTVVPDGDKQPSIRIRRESDITFGFAVGDVTPWFGKVSGATTNCNNTNQYFQRQIMGLVETGGISILGVSTLNAGAVLIEERVGSGRIMALDLLSLKEPFFDSWGSTNKYLFLGNLIGSTVHYGKHYARKLPYDELRLHMQQIAQANPRVTYHEEGPCSDGRPLASLSLGNPDRPGFLFTNGIHGWEWEAGYGLLHLVESLTADNPPEGLSIDDFYLKVVPQLNPYGYDHDFRHNANGVDLNRNFPYGWEQYAGGDDVYQPWDFDYKGPAPASEPETQIVMRLMEEIKPVVLLDFHTAHYILCKTGQGDQPLQDAIHEDIKARWKDRYLIQRPYSTEYQQANMDAVTTYGEAPHLVCYGAETGIPGSILIEMSGNRTGAHALVMNTDTTIDVCLAGLHNGLRYAAKRAENS